VNVGIALAIAAIVVGIGGVLGSLIAWGTVRRDSPRQAAVSVVRPRLIGKRPLSSSARVPLAALLAAVIAIVITVFLVPGAGKTPTPRSTATPAGGTSVAPAVVLADPSSQGIEGLAFSPAGTILATADLNGSVYLFNVTAPRLAASLEDAGTKGASVVAFSHDGTVLAVGDRNGNTYLWRESSGLPVSPEKSLRCDGASGVNALAFEPNGILAIGNSSASGPVCISTPAKDDILSTFHTSGGVDSLAFSPDGKLLATGTAGGAIYLWDMTTEKLAATLPSSDGERISSVAFSPDGKLLAAGGLTGASQLWDVASRRVVSTLLDPGSQGVSSVAFSPDGTTLATADINGKTYLWDTALNKIIAVLADPGGESVSTVAFSPNGRLIATGDLNGRIYLWNHQ
jgi:WD40 repeat protein